MAWGDVSAPITAMGRASAATLAFKLGEELRVAVVVKATFILAPDAPMVRTDPDAIVRADQPREKSPSSSLVAAGDLVPYRPRADVLLTGHARAPRDAPTPAMGVRLMVARGQEVVIDKRLAVRGTPDPSGKAREPLPFAAMSLAWELAAGGPDNPVGISEGTERAWPHIVDPRRPHQPAGFGPLSPRWHPRRRLLTIDERAFAAPIPVLPRDFAWAYFNAAPEDQRIELLRGDEWVGFEGMNSQLPRVQSCLPGVAGKARVYGPSPQLLAGQPLPLEADTLAIDTDRLRCSVVWRGSFPLPPGVDLRALHVFAGVESAVEPLSFPAAYVPSTAPAAPPQRRSPTRAPEVAPDQSSTVAVDISAFAAAAPATPFDAAPGAPRPIPQHLPPATPFERARNTPAPPPLDLNRTVDFTSLLSPSSPQRSPKSPDDTTEDIPLSLPPETLPPGTLPPALFSASPFPRALPFDPVAARPPPPPAPGSAPLEPPDAEAGATMIVDAPLLASALPFKPASGHPEPSASPPPAAGSRFDGSTTFTGSEPPRGPALPFRPDQAIVPEPVPVAPQGPFFPEVARPIVPAVPLTPADVSPAPPVMLDAPVPPPQAADGEAPKTIGALFLAAMARAGGQETSAGK